MSDHPEAVSARTCEPAILDAISMIPATQAAFAAEVVRSILQERLNRKGEPELDLPEDTDGIEVLSAAVVFCSITEGGEIFYAQTGEKRCFAIEGVPHYRAMLVYEGTHDPGQRYAYFGYNFAYPLKDYVEGNLPPALHRRAFDFFRSSPVPAGPRRALQLASAWRDLQNPYLDPDHMAQFA